MIVIAFISSILLALIIGVFIGFYITEYESHGKDSTDLSKMTDEEIRAKYIL